MTGPWQDWKNNLTHFGSVGQLTVFQLTDLLSFQVFIKLNKGWKNWDSILDLDYRCRRKELAMSCRRFNFAYIPGKSCSMSVFCSVLCPYFLPVAGRSGFCLDSAQRVSFGNSLNLLYSRSAFVWIGYRFSKNVRYSSVQPDKNCYSWVTH